jgi:hypothetical protein
MQVTAMISDEDAKKLHDRATRGGKLSPAEQAELDAWYARQDAEETAALAGAQPPHSLLMLRTQVEEVMAQLLTVTQRIQVQAAENERLRHEIAELQNQLAKAPAAQQV